MLSLNVDLYKSENKICAANGSFCLLGADDPFMILEFSYSFKIN